MRRLSKLFVLVLALALLCGVVFAVTSSAADATPRYWYEEDVTNTLTGATREHRDFTGEVVNVHQYVTAGVAASPASNQGVSDMWNMFSTKYGQLRTVVYPSGNTAMEIAYRADNDGTTTASDSLLGLHHKDGETVNDLTYVVYEFDMTTNSDYPGNIQLLAETRFFTGNSEESSKTRPRQEFGHYDAANSEWVFGASRFTFEAGEWVHISIAIQVNEKVDADGNIAYGDSVANVYVNGELVNTVSGFFPTKAFASNISARLYYVGVGYYYAREHVGCEADDSVVVDNLVLTTFDSTYTADLKEAKLDDLFAADGITDITDLPEFVYTSEYELPESEGLVSVLDADENEYGIEDGVSDLKSAMTFIEENEMEEVTIKLYADQYNPIRINYPTTVYIDTNGFALQNGWSADPQYIVTYDAESGAIVVEEDPEQVITLNYYNVPRAVGGDIVATDTIAIGRDYKFYSINKVKTGVMANGKTVYTPTGNYIVYDADGAVVNLEGVTEDILGNVYSVYPEYTELTFDSDVYFSMTLNGETTYYTSNDLWACATPASSVKSEVAETKDTAGVVTKTWTVVNTPVAIPSGAVITLLADCVVSTPLYAMSGDFHVDLNGYKLTSTQEILAANAVITTTPYTQVGDAEATAGTVSYTYIRNNNVFFYSSKEGAEINTASNYFIKANTQTNGGATNGVTYYFGYKTSSIYTDHRITLNFGAKLFFLRKGDLRYVRFAKMDMYNNVASSSGLIEAAQCRGLTVSFNDCNLFTKSPLTGSSGNSGAKYVSFTDSNVYAEGGVPLNYFYMKPNDKGEYVNGDNTIVLSNSSIYGMSIGDEFVLTGEGAVSAKLNVTVSGSSRISAIGVNVKADGSTLVGDPQSVTIDGKTYTTIYRIAKINEQTATFNIYDVTIDKLTAESVPVEVLNMVEGAWFATFREATNSIYDYANDPYHIITPSGFEVYDAQGNVVADKSAVVGATYSVCVVNTVEDVSFVVLDKNGNATPYLGNDIKEACSSIKDGNTTYHMLPEGSTLVMMKDCYCSNSLFLVSCSIDLNGNTFYVQKKQNSFTSQANANIFIYSSKAGAKIMQGPIDLSAGTCGYLLYANKTGANTYLGYQDADTMSAHRIEVFCGALAEVRGASDIYLAMLDVYRVCGDNYGFLNFRAGSSTDRNFYVDDCNFFCHMTDNRRCYSDFITLRECSAVGQATIRNSNIYADGPSPSRLVGINTAAKTSITGMTINLENVGFYGNMVYSTTSSLLPDMVINVKGRFESAFAPNDKFVFEDGMVVVPVGGSVATNGTNVPAEGTYGNKETFLYKGEYAYAYTAITEDSFKASAFQNMTLSTNVIGNLYVPAYENIASVLLGGVDILDKENIEIIGEKEYYVLSFGVAPKYGNRSLTLVVNFDDGNTASFEMSVANYAKALLGIAAGDNAYIADSQEMMKYILNYIKEVAVEFGGADAETIFADLGDIAVNADVTVGEEVKDTTAVQNYVTHAALNLDAYAGFAFKVAQGFVGELKIELAGVAPVEVAYTADEPAGENEVIVLENVPARLFRGDVTITVTPAEGEAVSAEYNLATYVSASEEAYAKAFYAYTVKAEEYYGKYPTVGTVD